MNQQNKTLQDRQNQLNRQRQALREAAGCWKDDNHPELAEGAAAYVARIRQEDNERFEELLRRKER